MEYKKLLVSNGGGIIGKAQQAAHNNDAHIFIGLGGTGRDALKVVKHEIYDRVKPDSADDDIPKYDNLRFLVVDTDDRADSGNADAFSVVLDSDIGPGEFFPIKVNGNNMQNELNRIKTLAPEQSPEFQWLTATRAASGTRGAGAVRQMGRMCLISKAGQLYQKIVNLINNATAEIKGAYQTYIHVVTGICGGTGSGCFIDVCNIARAALGNNGALYGYVFMPDVNLNDVSAAASQNSLRNNAYACLREIDYLMDSENNKFTFTQQYNGSAGAITLGGSPLVDFCYLISAESITNHYRPGTPSEVKNYAMRVLAEYLLFSVIEMKGFDLASHIANLANNVAFCPKKVGSRNNYAILGASCIRLPMREINTYLAASVFSACNFTKNYPNEHDVMDIITRLDLQDFQHVVDSALGTLGQNRAQGVLVDVNDYTLRDFIATPSNARLHNHFTALHAREIGKVETNIEGLLQAENEGSYSSRLRKELNDACADVNRGPIYASGLLTASAAFNLLNKLDSLIEEVNTMHTDKKNQMSKYTDQTEQFFETYNLDHLYKKLKESVDAKNFLGIPLYSTAEKTARFNAWKTRSTEFYRNKYECDLYDRIHKMLIKVKEDVEANLVSFYNSLAVVSKNLYDTFAANATYLTDPEYAGGFMDNFDKPFINLRNIKNTLQAELDKVTAANFWNQFIRDLIANPSVWESNNENKIAAFVTRKFIGDGGIFTNFANRNIENYLHDLYNDKNNGAAAAAVTDAHIAAAFSANQIKAICQSSDPLYKSSASIADMVPYDYMMIPEGMQLIQDAAEGYRDTVEDGLHIEDGSFNDRVVVMRFYSGARMSAYRDIPDLELAYSSVNDPAVREGRHYYAGTRNDNPNFNYAPQPDWTEELVSLVPYSELSLYPTMQCVFRDEMNRRSELFDRALKEGIIVEATGQVMAYNMQQLNKLEDLKKVAEQALAGNNINMITERGTALKNALASVGKTPVPGVVVCSNCNPGGAALAKIVMRDYFIQAPEIVRTVEAELGKLEAYKQIVKLADEAIDSIIIRDRAIIDYANLLFSGLIKIKGKIVYYVDEYESEQKLSDVTMEYGAAELYQAYESYKNLPDLVKDELLKRFNEYANNGGLDEFESNVFKETVTELAPVFTPERKKAYFDIVDFKYAANAKEIKVMLNKIFSAYNVFKAENGLI